MRSTRNRLVAFIIDQVKFDEMRDLMQPGDRFTLADLLRRPAWMAQAACRGQGPDLFFPARGEDSRPAKALCDQCNVLHECADYSAGLDGHLHGIWAGASERQRRRERREAA